MTILTGAWPARATWALLPLLLGPALGEALSEHSLAVARTESVLAWATWAGVLVAVLVPRTVSLTALRIAAPAAFGAAAWAAFAGGNTVAGAAGAGSGALAVVAALAPTTGDAFVNGSSYGDERRLPLRVPGPLLFGPLPLAWIAVVAGVGAGPLLLAARHWIAGGAASAVGLPVALMALRALHGLSRRWAVLVPAGLVLHDHHALAEPVLFARRTISRLGPAPVTAAREAVDLTQGAFGLALELELAEPTELVRRSRVAPRRTERVQKLLFTPTRPGALLAAAATRRFPVG